MTDVTVQKITKPEDRSLPIFRETEALLQRVRERAFDLFSGRGFGDGHALDDWLAAEHEVCWPAGELAESDAGYTLELALPGFEPADVSVTVTPRELIVHAKLEHKEESKKEKGEVRWSEFRSNDVYRRVELARDIDPGKVSATLKNGLLKISAPKATATARSVPVAAAA